MFNGGLVVDARTGYTIPATWDGVSRNPVNYTNAGYRIMKVA